MVFSMDKVRGKRIAALVLAANTFIAFWLSVFFFFNYSNEIGQLALDTQEYFGSSDAAEHGKIIKLPPLFKTGVLLFIYASYFAAGLYLHR